MGCAASVYAIGRKKKFKIPEITFFFPTIRVPVTSSDLQTTLRGLIPNDLAHTISSLRNQIVFIAHDTGGSAFVELRHALEQYLSLLIGLTKKEHGLEYLVEFKWKALDGTLEMSVANSWFELLSVLHMMAMLALAEASSFLIPKHTTSSNSGDQRIVSPDSMREAIDLLLKAAGYLDFCIRDVLVLLPPHIRNKLPESLHESVMESILNQALAQGTELQLGLAVGSQNATLSVKRRLACELLSYLGKAHYCLSEGNTTSYADGRKHLLFIKWKYLEAKAAAYYYHGLITDKGTEPSCHINAVCCFLAAEELLAESKKACLSFCLSDPVTRAPPPWGVMKYLNKKIPETASKKYQMYGGYLLEQDNRGLLQELPDLPEFQLSLKPDDYELPEIHPLWDTGKWDDICGQSLKEHLNDFEDGS